MTESVRRDFLTLANGRQLHCRRTGTGAPVVLLHPSPLSSAFLEPLMNFLAQEFELVALDTPGYGESDPLVSPGDGLAPYVEVLAETLELLGLERVLLYGNATGAQLAIECAKAHPTRLAGLVLENAAAFSDQERTQMLDGYFPDFTPRDDGAHLAAAWDMARKTFSYFPWYDDSQPARPEPPAELVQSVALATLRAGPDYARAYRAAFANERPEQLAAVDLPTRVVLWQDSILARYSRRLQAAELPGHIEFVEAGPGIEARFGAVRSALRQIRGKA